MHAVDKDSYRGRALQILQSSREVDFMLILPSTTPSTTKLGGSPRLDMSTLMPFLYQTRTLARVARLSHPLRRGLHATAPRKYDDELIPFELPPGFEDNRQKQEPPRKQDTLTPTERQTFENIFREISQMGKRPKLPKAKEKQKDEMPSIFAALQSVGADGKPTKRDAAFNVSAIVEHAASTYSENQPGIKGLDPLSPLEATYSAAERERALLRFPPALRSAARMAFGLFEPVHHMPTVRVEGGQKLPLGTKTADPVEAVESAPSKDQVTYSVEVEAKRRAERLRISGRMLAARDDFELWDIIEQEVFPLVNRLGIADRPPNPSFKPRIIKRTKRKAVVEVEEAKTPPEEAETTEENALDMETYGPIYPHLLLEGLKLLDSKFARPSPYALHILPRVKQAGLVSYVLGVSTSFYNRLISLLWDRYGDAQGVLSLLEEMRHAGLYFDENSKAVVHHIEQLYMAADQGKKGRFAHKLMKMPEYEPILAVRLHHWVGHIDRSIKERQRGLGF